MARIQVTRNPKRQLQPSASPVSTYVAPAAAERSSLGEIAGALSQFSPELRRMGAAQDAKDREAQEASAERKIAGMTFEEAKAAVKSGEMGEFNNPWFRAGFMKQYGIRMGNNTKRNLEQELSEEDLVNTDVEAVVRGRMQEKLAEFGDDKFAVAGFLQATQGMAETAMQKRNEAIINKTQDDVDQGILDGWRATADMGIEEGVDPVVTARAIRQSFSVNADILGRSKPDQDRLLLSFAQSLAVDGKVDLVRELLEGNNPSGRLIDDVDLGLKAQQIVHDADKVFKAKQQEENYSSRLHINEQVNLGEADPLEIETLRGMGILSDPEAMALTIRNANIRAANAAKLEADRQRLVLATERRAIDDRVALYGQDMMAAGNLAYLSNIQVTDSTGKVHEYTVEAQTKDAVNRYLDASQKIAIANKETPDQKFAREADAFRANGQVNPIWEEVLSRGPAIANLESVNADEIPGVLADSLELYVRLHAQAPRLAGNHVGGKNTEFYEAYRVLTQVAGQEPRAALQMAHKFTSDIDGTRQQSAMASRREIGAVLNKMDANDSWLPGFDSEIENIGDIKPELIRLAALYAGAGGLSNEKALEQAQLQIEATHTLVAGRLINTADRRIPPNFGELVEIHLGKWAEAHGVDVDLYSIMADPNTRTNWAIVLKHNGMLAAQENRVFDMGVLSETNDERVLELKERIAEEAQKGAQAADDLRKQRRSDGKAIRDGIKALVPDALEEFVDDTFFGNAQGDIPDNGSIIADGLKSVGSKAKGAFNAISDLGAADRRSLGIPKVGLQEAQGIDRRKPGGPKNRNRNDDK